MANDKTAAEWAPEAFSGGGLQMHTWMDTD